MENGLSGSVLKRKLLVIDDQDIEKLLSMEEALAAVEYVFRLIAEGQTIMPPKLYLDLPEYKGDFRAMPCYIDGCAGLKWVCVYPHNRQRNLPCVMATIILSDPYTGSNLAIMDGTYITAIRTGAAGGVAVKYLARRDSSVIGMIGAGKQAETQLRAIREVLPIIRQVKVYDIDKDARLRYTKKMGTMLNVNVIPVENIEEAAEADIVVTTTPSREPIIKRQHIKPGTHINAIGADAPGKQELDSDLLKGAKVVVDDIKQASHSGEINVPLSKGLLRIEQIYGTLGEIVAGIKKGREKDEEITIFDSTGLATEDIICAKIAYKKAIRNENARFIHL